jgi:DNA-directed RNA polymerase specialized sigma subunit
LKPDLTFTQACIAGRADPAQIDDWIENRHTQPTELELHEYLGLSLDEYGQWLTAPACLPELIAAKTRAS